LELGDLTVELACGEALTQALDAVHLGFGSASAVISFGAALEPAAGQAPHHRRQIVRPTRFDVRRTSLQGEASAAIGSRTMPNAPGLSGFQGLAFLRGGMIAAAPLAVL
jgi:hypothetical protein